MNICKYEMNIKWIYVNEYEICKWMYFKWIYVNITCPFS